MSCQVCFSILRAGDLFCSSCGAAVPDHPPTAATAESRNRIAGERKYLTVLCADLQRSTDLISDLDPEAAISRLEPALNAMRAAVRRNRGIVSKEGGDGLIALFGAPHADDNHAVMACQAAAELVRRIKFLNDPGLHVRVGVHSGYVVAHVIEADLSSIYEAGGAAVHLVKRLEGAAQAGQIIVSESCQGLCAGLVNFKALPPKRLEGFSTPVPCYEFVEISGLTRWRARSTKGVSTFVGRKAETSILEQAAREVGATGRALALVGTAGIGKSRVAHEFAETLRQQDWQVLEADISPQDWQVLEADSSPIEQAVPYSLLKKLLQNALQMTENEPVRQYELAEGPFDSSLWPAALSALLDQRVDDPRWHEAEPLLRRRAINEAVRDRIDRAVGTRRTLLLLEDLHWIDGQSQTAIEGLLSLIANRPLLVLLTWRTENAPDWLTQLEIRKIWLRSLDRSAGKQLLDDLLGPDDHLDEIKTHVLRHTGQVPLFIEEVARQLTERGVLPSPGRIVARSTWESLGIPPTVQGVIASRIDRLSREDKSMLQLAAVVGPRVSPQLLAAVTGLPLAQLQSQLWSLEILDFLVESRWLASVEYEFAHDLIREVAYDSILRPQREDLHRRILAALEASSAGREEEVAEALCHHAVKAQDWAKADRYGEMAAKKAFVRSAFRDATEYFQIAMDAVDKLPFSVARERRAIDLRTEARLAFGPFGKMEEWLVLCRDAEQRSENIGDEGRRLASIAIRAAALNFYGTPYEGMTAGRQAVALAQNLNSATWLSFVEYGLGQSCFIAGKFREARRWLEQASGRLAASPHAVPPGTTGPSLLALCHMMNSLVCVWMGEFELAERCVDDARELAQESCRPYDMIAATYASGFLELWRGNFREAEMALGLALGMAQENEVRQFLPHILGSMGNLYVQHGQPARARDLLLAAAKEAEAQGHQSSSAVLPAYLSMAYTALGDVSQGLITARSGRAGARQKGYAGVEALAALAEANALVAQASHPEQAFECLKRVVELASELEARSLLALARRALDRLLAGTGGATEAHQALVHAIDHFDGPNDCASGKC